MKTYNSYNSNNSNNSNNNIIKVEKDLQEICKKLSMCKEQKVWRFLANSLQVGANKTSSVQANQERKLQANLKKGKVQNFLLKYIDRVCNLPIQIPRYQMNE